MESKDVIIFDLDKTLANSKSPIDEEMSGLLEDLLQTKKVCVVSGGNVEQFKEQLLQKLPENTNTSNLIVAPTSGAAMYLVVGNDLQKIYAHSFSTEDIDLITKELEHALEATDFDFSLPSYGERIENRGSQISFSILGQQAPLEEKQAIDPDKSMRENIIEHLQPSIPGFEARIGGSNTIDITKAGIDKAYAIDQLTELLETPITKMIYVGDALFEGGNDEVVKETGIETKQVKNPEETKEFIQSLL
jgi:phosphomannomutase